MGFLRALQCHPPTPFISNPSNRFSVLSSSPFGSVSLQHPPPARVLPFRIVTLGVFPHLSCIACVQNHHLQASFTGFSFSPDHNLVARKQKKSQANLQALLATPFLTLLRARFGPSASRDSLAAHLSGVTLKSSALNPRDLRPRPV